ncbi:MAG: formimidoylglutamase [Pyrinomonadaceae bacterium]
MTDIFKLTTRPSESLFFKRNDRNDVRLGETVSTDKGDYTLADIVILGCPQDDGVIRNYGRSGAAAAPDEIRRAFYKLTNFGVNTQIFDLGNTIIQPTLEETHDVQTAIVQQLLRDNKKIISLGGGNDISYPDCKALCLETDNVLAFNVDAHFDVRADELRSSGTPYRQLLAEKLIEPQNFYEIGYQPEANSPIYFEYLQRLGVHTISLEEFRQIGDFSLEIFKLHNDRPLFWGFDVDVVRSSDAPGVSAPSPIGLMADEFCDLAALAGFQPNTRIVEFTEVNPNYDRDGQTAKLVAIAMHRFCTAIGA